MYNLPGGVINVSLATTWHGKAYRAFLEIMFSIMCSQSRRCRRIRK